MERYGIEFVSGPSRLVPHVPVVPRVAVPAALGPRLRTFQRTAGGA